MQTKYLQRSDSGEMEVSVMLSTSEIILIKDAIGLYKGDHDDPNVIKTKEELNKGLHEA